MIRADALTALSQETKRWLWIGLLTGASILFSLALACATPFAALAALAALNMSRRDALVLTATVWLANQAIGYGVLHYPRSVDSYAWGLAIGAAAIIALFAAMRGADRFAPRGRIVATAAGFLAGFAAYEGVLFAASLVLGGSDAAFAWPVMRWILEVNVLALAGLMVLHRLALIVGLVTHRPISTVVAAT